MTVLPGFFRAYDRPHALLRYISFTAPGSIGLDFRGVLEEYPFSRGQRLAVLVAWQLFNGGDRDGPRADFDVVCAALDASNFEAVIDGMRLHAGRDPGNRIRSRIEERLHDIYKEWEEGRLVRAGLVPWCTYITNPSSSTGRRIAERRVLRAEQISSPAPHGCNMAR